MSAPNVAIIFQDVLMLSAIPANVTNGIISNTVEGDWYLYVSTGGITKDTRYEADRANVALKLLGLVNMRKLLVDHFERLDEDEAVQNHWTEQGLELFAKYQNGC